MRYIHKTTENFLNKELGLDATGYEQDWCLELADDEKIDCYIKYYKTSDRNDDIDFALLSLISASFDEKIQGTGIFASSDIEYDDLFIHFDNDIVTIYGKEILDHWKTIKKIALSNKDLFKQIVDYWSKNDPDECSCASSLLYRDLLAEEFTNAK